MTMGLFFLRVTGFVGTVLCQISSLVTHRSKLGKWCNTHNKCHFLRLTVIEFLSICLHTDTWVFTLSPLLYLCVHLFNFFADLWTSFLCESVNMRDHGSSLINSRLGKSRLPRLAEHTCSAHLCAVILVRKDAHVSPHQSPLRIVRELLLICGRTSGLAPQPDPFLFWRFRRSAVDACMPYRMERSGHPTRFVKNQLGRAGMCWSGRRSTLSLLQFCLARCAQSCPVETLLRRLRARAGAL